jgi:hypothetical protein
MPGEANAGALQKAVQQRNAGEIDVAIDDLAPPP